MDWTEYIEYFTAYNRKEIDQWAFDLAHELLGERAE